MYLLFTIPTWSGAALVVIVFVLVFGIAWRKENKKQKL